MTKASFIRSFLPAATLATVSQFIRARNLAAIACLVFTSMCCVASESTSTDDPIQVTARKNGETITVARQKVSRADVTRFLCPPLTFHISGLSVVGNAGGRGEGMYAPVTRLVAPDFQTYLKEARESTIYCPGFKPQT